MLATAHSTTLSTVLANRRFRVAFLTIALFLLLSGDAVRFAVGWWGYGVLAVATTIMAGWLLWLQRSRWSIAGLPLSLLAFLTLATVSIFWSHYPGATALGLLTTWLIVVNAIALAVTFTWAELLRALGIVLRFVIAASLLFELCVSVIIRHGVLPFFGQPGVDYSSYKKIPGMLLWSRNELFDVGGSGRIQGIVGNSNSLGFLALLALIVFGIQVASRTASPRWGTVWLVLAAGTILMTKSATVTVAGVVVAVVLAIALLVRHARTGRGRVIVYSASGAVLVAGLVLAFLLRSRIFELLGKSSDLTGRFGIWQKVNALAEQRPAFGWGWVSYWMPWADPFHNLIYRSGVRQLQAHNTWVDVSFQLGFVGLVIFIILVGAALVKSWQHAVDRVQTAPRVALPHTVLTLLPLLILVALIVQSFAESRLITEYGFAFLLLIAVKTKRRELL